jgi:hypothetical protein
VLFLDLDATDAFLHTIAASLRAISPSLPLIPFSMNWAMGKEALPGSFICTCISWTFNTPMVRLDSDLAVADLLTIPTGSGTIAPRCPLREFTVNRTFLVVAIALMHHTFILDACLTWERHVEVTLSTTMLWRDGVYTCSNNSASTACHAAFALLPFIRLAINWAREGVAVNPAIHLVRACITTIFVLNLDVALLLLGATAA